jgi:alcohol dehydrogenase (nicotinoprotein)
VHAGHLFRVGAVSQYSVVKVDEWLPLEVAVLVGRGVPTGWGTATEVGRGAGR